MKGVKKVIVTVIKVLVVATLGALTGILTNRFIERYILLPLFGEFIELGEESYLNGFPIWEYLRNQTFGRLGRYIWHGLCYEASAIMMLMLKGHRKTRFVYGEALSRTKFELVEHCWLEVKACGIWWAVDPTWIFPVRPMSILFHRLLVRSYAIRKIPDTEFFSHDIASEMAEVIRGPETSYIFHDLACFRRAYWNNKANNSKSNC